MEQPVDPHKRPSDQASARNTEAGARFDKTLFAALDAIEGNGLPYGLIGGVAASGLGRPRPTHDVDIFVRAEDAESILESLGQAGFQTERYDPRWLYKAFRDEMLVDIIFKSQGDIYFDDEMVKRVAMVAYHGRDVRVVSPEDLIIIKCAVHNENGPHHWHDALAILSHAPVDWDYLLRRARRAPRRVLALLVYAQSSDIWIPDRIIDDLFCAIYREKDMVAGEALTKAAPPGLTHLPPPAGSASAPRPEPPAYLAGRIKDAIAGDGRLGQQDVHIAVEGDHLLIKGESRSEEHRRLIEEVARAMAPQLKIDNQVRVSVLRGPEGTEYVS